MTNAGRKIKIKKPALLEAIKTAHGMKTGVCELLGISRPTLDRYIEADIEIQEAIEFAQVRKVDRAEYKLGEAIERGEAWAIQLALKDSKRGRERGFGNAMDITSGGKPLNWKDFINANTEPDNKESE